MLEQKTALVTGAHGTVGRYVSLALARRKWQVVGAGHGKWVAADQKAWGLSRWVEDEVRLDRLRALPFRPALIVHCAGSGAVGASITAPYADFQRTVETTAAVLEFQRADCPGAVLVYPSSAAVYGVASSLPMTESLPSRPTSPYGVHKKIAEELVAEHSRLFGLKAAVVRLFSIYGEGFRKQLLWDACQRIAAHDASQFFGTGGETRDWLHATDAAELLATASEHASASCPVINGGSGESIAVSEVLTELFHLMGRDQQPRFCGTQRPGDPLHYHAEISHALSWGWRPAVSWQEGLQRYVSWFKRENGLA